jgi:hypothetical protein
MYEHCLLLSNGRSCDPPRLRLKVGDKAVIPNGVAINALVAMVVQARVLSRRPDLSRRRAPRWR